MVGFLSIAHLWGSWVLPQWLCRHHRSVHQRAGTALPSQPPPLHCPTAGGLPSTSEHGRFCESWCRRWTKPQRLDPQPGSTYESGYYCGQKKKTRLKSSLNSLFFFYFQKYYCCWNVHSKLLIYHYKDLTCVWNLCSFKGERGDKSTTTQMLIHTVCGEQPTEREHKAGCGVNSRF